MINITAIKLLESFDSYKNTEGEKAEFLEPVSKINIFVGSNNSGKSRFMRELSQQTDYKIKLEMPNLQLLNISLINIIEGLENFIKTFGLTALDDVTLGNLENMRFCIYECLNTNSDTYEVLRSHFSQWSKMTEIQNVVIQQNGQHNWSRANKEGALKKIQIDSERALELLSEIPIYSKETAPQKVYIPTLRGLRSLDNKHTDFYTDKTRQDYFHHQLSGELTHLEEVERKRPEIFTGLSLYERITDLLLGNNADRKLISKYQEFISEKLFEGKSVALIPNQKDKVVIVKIGNEKEQPIHHLGDGIQSTIILTFLPLIMQGQTFFFIEEPEMFLHPGLQRKLLDFYSSLKQHTFFLTTHSNHFLDITIDIKDVSIFTFRKILGESGEDELTPDFTIEAVDSGCESSLELLGVRNSSVFLVNATIWVEGITDRWYFRKMLESYMKHLETNHELKMRLEEDTHYSFVEYGGANITHWSFLDKEVHPIEVERLCAKALVIIDGDGDNRIERKDKLKKRLKDNLIILPCREIENALPYDVIRQVVLEYEKDENLEIKDFSFESYKDEYLGTFIETKMLKNNPDRQGVYRIKPQQGKKTTGTIKDKKGFCEKAKSRIQYADLDGSIKKVVADIYDFIYQQNS